MNLIDLQVQTTASDGKHTPREVVQMAREQRLKAIAITDHDTVGGVEEALVAGQEIGVEVIPGVEMSVEEHDAHILGFGIDHKNQQLVEKLESFQIDRIERAKEMTRRFKEAGFSIEWENVKKRANGAVTSPHVVFEILENPANKEKLGAVTSKHEFYETFLRSGSPFVVRRNHISAKEAIELLHNARGIAIWSHPAIHFAGDHEAMEKFLEELLGWGIDGIEVYSPAHTEDDIEILANLATKHNLLITAGSDFHEKGEHVANEKGLHSARTVGDYETYGFAVGQILPRLKDAISARQ